MPATERLTRQEMMGVRVLSPLIHSEAICRETRSGLNQANHIAGFSIAARWTWKRHCRHRRYTQPRAAVVSSPVPPEMDSPDAPAHALSAGGLQLDVAKYRRYVEDLDLTEPQAADFLQTMWFIMSSFVDLGFGVDSVHQALPPSNQGNSPPNRKRTGELQASLNAADKEDPS